MMKILSGYNSINFKSIGHLKKINLKATARRKSHFNLDVLRLCIVLFSVTYFTHSYHLYNVFQVTTRKDIILELRYLQMIQKQTGHFMVQISGLLKVKLFPVHESFSFCTYNLIHWFNICLKRGE